MARRHHYRRRTKDAHELDVTTFLNLMVVLVPFLLITAVFSRLAIIELNLPSSTGSAQVNEQGFRPEVIVRESVIEITNGTSIIASIPKVEEEYDFETLSDFIIELKREYPDQEAASVLVEKHIPYDYLIQTMDYTRSAELPAADESEEPIRVALFPNISIGEAP